MQIEFQCLRGGLQSRDEELLKECSEEFDEMLQASDDIVKDAYSRMNYDKGKQKWTQGTTVEVDLITQYAELKAGDTVFDFGCGQGRHTLELARHHFKITAIDYVRENIEKLRQEITRCGSQENISVLTGDCRSIKLPQQTKCIICLYDVIGSYTDNRQNRLILKNIYRHLKNNGITIISVMNYDYEPLAAKAEKIDFPDELKERLFELSPSPTMETSGNVFSPDYCVIDANTHTVYRKEQFSIGSELPAELLVRDRRFTKQEIEDMCRETGFEVLLSRYVKAGKWENELSPKESKEILLVCQKRTRNQRGLFD